MLIEPIEIWLAASQYYKKRIQAGRVFQNDFYKLAQSGFNHVPESGPVFVLIKSSWVSPAPFQSDGSIKAHVEKRDPFFFPKPTFSQIQTRSFL